MRSYQARYQVLHEIEHEKFQDIAIVFRSIQKGRRNWSFGVGEIAQ